MSLEEKFQGYWESLEIIGRFLGSFEGKSWITNLALGPDQGHLGLTSKEMGFAAEALAEEATALNPKGDLSGVIVRMVLGTRVVLGDLDIEQRVSNQLWRNPKR